MRERLTVLLTCVDVAKLKYRRDMSKTKKLHWVAIVVLAILVFTTNKAYSQIWIEERQRAELPLTLVPGTRKKLILTPNNKLGGNSNAEVVGGQTVSGHYYIQSDSDKTISISLLSNEDVSELRLKRFKVKYKGVTYKSFPAVGLPSPGNGEDIFIGFTVIVKSSAVEGEKYPSYILDVSEE